MYECPNCGGNLRFDIPTQSLFCDYCHTQLNPYSYQKDHDAAEHILMMSTFSPVRNAAVKS